MADERYRVRAPRQARSQRTLDRILNAAEAMLEDRTFESAPVTAIVRRARSSIGSFYARFGSKETLLAALFERFQADMVRNAAERFAVAETLPPALAPRAAFYVGVVVEFCAAHRGVLRARMIRNVTREAPGPARQAERSRELVQLAHGLFAPCRGEIAHADPVAALDFALQMVDAVAGLRLLAPGTVTEGFAPVSTRALTVELTRAMTGYLAGPEPARGDGPVRRTVPGGRHPGKRGRR